MIIKALTDRIDVMYADPPKADTTTACAAGSYCDQSYKAQLGDMANQQVHYENYPPLEVLSVDKVVDVAATSNGEIATGTVYEVTYSVASGDFSNAHIVDADGKVVANLGPGKDAANVVSGTRMLTWFPEDPELPWRFVD